MVDQVIRPARPEEAAELTGLSFRSKGWWGYPASYFEIWRGELTISAHDIAGKTVFVHEDKAVPGITGYYSLVLLEEDLMFSGGVLARGWWLEHMFVEPVYIGRGIGARLFRHMRETCRGRRITTVGILADPHARGFYEKMGCVYLGEYASTIPGRTTPHLAYCARASAVGDLSRDAR